MFSYLLSSISSTLAPERNFALEFHSLLKNGYLDQALALLRSNSNDIDVHALGSTGLAPIHFASGAGHLEMLAELLSLGVDVCTPSSTSNHPLHYACTNNCKSVVAFLLRSGADTSFPNGNGKIAAELTTDPEIKSMLLAVPENPIVHHSSDEYHSDISTSPTSRNPPTAHHVDTTLLSPVQLSHKEPLTAFEDPVICPDVSSEQPASSPDHPTILSTEPPRPHNIRKISPAPIKPPSDTSHRASDASESDLIVSDSDRAIHSYPDPTVVTRTDSNVTSSLFLPSPSRASNAEVSQQRNHRVKRRYSLPPGHPTVELPSSPAAAPCYSIATFAKSMDALSLARDDVPASDSNQVEEKKPARRRHTVSRYKVSLESPSGDACSSAPPVIVPLVETPKRPPSGKPSISRRPSSLSDVWNFAGSASEDVQDDSNVSSEESSSLSPRASPRASIVSLPPPLPPPPISPQVTSGKQVSPRPYFTEKGRSTPPSNYPSYPTFLPAQHTTLDIDRMHTAVLLAAKETALAYKATLAENEIRRDVFKACQQVSNASLVDRMVSQFELYPHMATCRAAEIANYAADGATPLHAAAAWGNLKAIEALLKTPGVSVWSRDLQGRLPLHLAAEKEQSDACAVLMAAMRLDSQIDPIGQDAPVDLAGLTPIGWATQRKKKKPSEKITDLLYKPGDGSILPRTPFRHRVGKSPLKPRSQDSHHATARGNVDVMYAFSEAGGWRPTMEDKVISQCPLVPGCSVFGVLDGHGGDFCAQFLEKEIPKQIIAELCNISNTTDETSIDVNALSLTHHAIENLLTTACLEADASLAAVPRMRISTSAATGKLVVYETCGSTGCVCLITDEVVAVANVGDSRAVLGCWNEAGSKLEALALSRDHKLSIESERERAINAGCTVAMDETNTVWEVRNPALKGTKKDSRLRMSRSFGDFYLKQNKELPATLQGVTATPEVNVHEHTNRDSFIIIACDGIWDVLTNEEAVDFVACELNIHDSRHPVLIDGTDLARVTDSLLELCIGRGSGDNMTAMIIVFNRNTDIMRMTEDVSNKVEISTPDVAQSPTANAAENIDPSTSEYSVSPIRAVKLF